MAPKKLIFGNENAEKDPLVRKCYIENIKRGGQIITGRWGVGKTAYLFHKNSDLERALEKIDFSLKRSWYISESELDTDQIIDAYTDLETLKFKRYLRKIWRAEIYRRACVLLSALQPNYSGKNIGLHWKTVSGIAKAGSTSKTVWQQLPAVLNLLKVLDQTGADSLSSVQRELGSLFDTAVERSVQNCLYDIVGESIQPVVAIEPIETPFSELESNSLAQEIIGELVNTFQQHFQPGEDQLLEVVISIPWHRFSHQKNVNLPQKIRQYVEYASWNRESLKKFIDRRIEVEFEEKRRPHSKRGADYWSILFEASVHNNIGGIPIVEGTFDYVLRHTSYRPREVQRIARLAVEACARKSKVSPETVIRGVNGVKVSGSHVKEAIGEYVEGAARDRQSESIRRFHDLELVLSYLKGVPVPCSIEDLTQRIPHEIQASEAISWLWQSGILGLRGTCSIGQVESLSQSIPERNYRVLEDNRKKKYYSWCFFEYNTDGEFHEIFDKYAQNSELTIECVIHPLMHEELAVHLQSELPIGK